MSTDTILTPAGQSAVVGHGREGCLDHGNASALHLLASDHRNAIQVATEGRFTEHAHADTLREFTNLEARNGERFATLANQVKEEASRTREMIQAQTIESLRFDKLRLEMRAPA